MKILRIISPLFLLIILLSTSCKDDCTPPTFSKNIIGTWEIFGKEVEFLEDGSLLDPDNALLLINFTGQEFDRKSYEIEGNKLIIKASRDGGWYNNTTEYSVAKVECDKIILERLGFKTVLRRS